MKKKSIFLARLVLAAIIFLLSYGCNNGGGSIQTQPLASSDNPVVIDGRSQQPATTKTGSLSFKIKFYDPTTDGSVKRMILGGGIEINYPLEYKKRVDSVKVNLWDKANQYYTFTFPVINGEAIVQMNGLIPSTYEIDITAGVGNKTYKIFLYAGYGTVTLLPGVDNHASITLQLKETTNPYFAVYNFPEIFDRSVPLNAHVVSKAANGTNIDLDCLGYFSEGKYFFGTEIQLYPAQANEVEYSVTDKNGKVYISRINFNILDLIDAVKANSYYEAAYVPETNLTIDVIFPDEIKRSDLFKPYITFSVKGLAYGVAIGDLIGKNDVVLVTGAIGHPENGRELHIFSGDKVSTYNLAGDPISVEIGDIDGDGKNDIVVPLQQGDIKIFYKTAAGFRPDLIQTGEAVKLRLADVNNDGVQEIITVGIKSNKLVIYDRSGRGNLTKNDYDIPHTGCKDLAVGDFDGDGLKDIAILDNSGIMIVFQSANYGFYQADNLHIPVYSPSSFVVADIDGDGQTEILVSSGSGSPNSSITVFKLQGKLFKGITYLSIYDIARAIKAADVNGDGKQDIAALYQDEEGQDYIGVFIQKSDGNFADEQLYKLPFAWRGLDGNNLALGDIDNDGRIDIAIADIDNGLVTLLGK